MAQYVVLLHDDQDAFGVYKNTSADPEDESNWSAQDGSVYQGLGIIRSLWAFQEGTNIHVVSVNDAGGGDNRRGICRYSVFSTSSDTWTTKGEFVVNIGIASTSGTLAANEYGCSVAVRSDGDVIVLLTRIPANGVPIVQYARKESGSWTVNFTVESGAGDFIAGVIVPGSSDRMHFVYTDATNDDLKSRTLNSANSLSSVATIDGSPGVLFHLAAPGAHYDDGGTERVRVPYVDLNGQISVAECDSADAPTWGVTADASDADVTFINDSSVMCMSVDAKNLQLLYAGIAAADIWRTQNPDDGGWDTDIEENDGVTCNRISCGVYDRSGQKLGYIWDNGGTITFDEIDLVAFDTAVLAAMQQTIIPASVPIPSIAY